MEASVSYHPSDCIIDFPIRHQSARVSLFYTSKCPCNSCGQNITTAENQSPHLVGVFSWNRLADRRHIATIVDSRRNIPPQGKFLEFLLILLSEKRFCDYCYDSCYCFSSTFSATKYERYLVITYPFKYLELITEPPLTSSVVTVWAVATLFTVLTSVYTVNNAFILNFRRVITVASISILIFCHFAVYREARSQILKIATQQISTEARAVLLKEKKALNTTTMVIGVVFLSFVPLIIFRPVLKSLIGPPAWKFVLLYALKSLALCNSVCNPLIYCARNREFRKAFERLLRICRQSQMGPA